MIVQEAVVFDYGHDCMPIKMRLRLPDRKADTTIYLLSNSYEYDIELIKNTPQPKLDYKNLIIPFKITTKIGTYPLRYIQNQNEYNRKIQFVNNQKLIPKPIVLRPPFPNKIKDNVYVSMSDLMNATKPIIQKLPLNYLKEHIIDIFLQVMKPFTFSSKQVMIIDTTKYAIFDRQTPLMFKSDMINALLGAYMFSAGKPIKRIPLTIIFRGPDADFRLDLSRYDDRDIQRMRRMLSIIGQNMGGSETDVDVDIDSVSIEDDGREEIEDLNSDDIESEGDEETPTTNASVASEINASVNSIRMKMVSDGNMMPGPDEDISSAKANEKKLRQAKELNVHAELLKRISVNTGMVGNYKTIANDMTEAGNSPVEDKYIDLAAQKAAKVTIARDDKNAMGTATAAREQKMRERIGKLKLGDVTFDTLTSVTDVPKPAPVVPLKISSINPGTMKGVSFANISKAYEENLMDRDIVETFMNLSKLPDGFEITNVEVTDISTVHSLVNDWKVSLRSKNTGRLNTIHVHVPKVINGKFYNNGIWYNLGKQDFPIPILKLGPKRVMLTSNYQKITVQRYDTRSLVDIGILVKVLSNLLDEAGNNKYVVAGSSVATNSRFMSTVEYDEFAKVWYSFKNKEKHLELNFNRETCLREYGFVNVDDTTFCCGMENQVPIIINTETGLDQNDRSITDIIINSLPPDLQKQYQKVKPGKRAMFSEMNAGEKTPVGLTCCAWEGITNVLKKSNAQYQVIGPREMAPNGMFAIDFKDCRLAIKNTIPNQLLWNGFRMIDTKQFKMSEFETPIMNPSSIYVDIYNKHFFRQYSQLTTFIAYYNFFLDAMTYDVCSHFNLPTDIVGMLIYASNMLADNNYALENTASLYRVRSTEVIPAIIHSEIAFAISKYNNSSGSKSRDHMLKFNPNSVIITLETLGTTETANALNPAIELHQREVISQRGWHGVNVDRAYTKSKRSYHDSMIGKLAMSSPNSANVGINKQLTVDPKIESVRGYTSTEGPDAEYNDMQLCSYSELLTPGTISHDDAIRNAIATSQTGHIVQTEEGEPTLISNGVDELVAAAVSDEFAVIAEEDGKVIDVANGYMIVQYKSGKKRAIEVDNRYHANPASGFYVNNKLEMNFKLNETFKKNDILAYHAKFFTKGIDNVVRMNIGPVAKVALAGTYFTYEDSGMMTESFSKKLATSITMVETIKLDATANVESIVKVGDEVEVGDPLVILGLGDTGDKNVDNFLKAFRADSGSTIIDSAKRTFKAKHAGKIVDVRIYTIKSTDKLSPSLSKIMEKEYADNLKKRKILDKHDKTDTVYKLDTLYDRPTGPIRGQQIKGISTDVLIEVYIEHMDFQSVGDKLVAFAASKQVIADMVPIGLEPYSELLPDEEVSVFVSPRSILGRMIPSLVTVACGNKVLIELKRRIKTIWES